MNREEYLSISEFSKQTGFTRRNLLFYDQIDIIKPAYRAENGYRYYSYSQISTVWLIRVLSELEMPLSEIKVHLAERSPEKIISLYGEQIEKLKEEKRRIEMTIYMMESRIAVTKKGMHVKEGMIELEELPEEYMLIGEEPREGASVSQHMTDFTDMYKDVVRGIPSGFMYSKERLLSGDWIRPGRYYFRMPKLTGEKRPGGLYVVGYTRCEFRKPYDLYEQMLEYIEQNGLSVSGNTYEDYLFNETVINDFNTYLIQISIQVERQ